MSTVQLLRSSLDLQRPDNWLSCPIGGAFEVPEALRAPGIILTQLYRSFSSVLVLLFSSDLTQEHSF